MYISMSFPYPASCEAEGHSSIPVHRGFGFVVFQDPSTARASTVQKATEGMDEAGISSVDSLAAVSFLPFCRDRS